MTSIIEVLRTNLTSISSSRKNRISLEHLIKNNSYTTTKTSLQISGLFPDFYASYDYNTDNNSSAFQLFGLFSSDYDEGSVPSGNESFSIGQKSENSDSKISAPFFYVLFMLGLYLVIIFTTFISALYSHRKRVGYNYDDECSTSSDDSSDEHQLLEPENQKHKENIELVESSKQMFERFNQEPECENPIFDVDVYSEVENSTPRKKIRHISSKIFNLCYKILVNSF